MFSASELVLIRHAAADTNGRLCGRTDVGLATGTDAALAQLSKILPEVTEVLISPAKRCRLTAEALWPAAHHCEDARLWEQDFGAWEGQAFSDLPDIGEVSRSEMSMHCSPNGESFCDLCSRAQPALRDAAHQARLGQAVVIVAHAGIVRAGLSLALGDESVGLAFEVDPLSITRLRCLPDGGFAVGLVNWRPV